MRGRFRLARNGSKALTRAFGATSPARGEVKESTSTPDSRIRSRGALMRPSFASHDHDAIPKIGSLPAKKGAERRKAHANHRRHADKCAVCALVCVRGGSAPMRGALAFRRSAAALARANASAVGSAPVPAFPETRSRGRYPLRSVTSLPRSAETGRSAGRAVARSRPGADGKSARRHRPRSAFQACLPERRPR